MTAEMNRRERLAATFAGETVDRPPVALWRHWPVDDQRGDKLAHATLLFQRTYDFDFIKITPSSNYSVAGYGVESWWEGNQEGTRTKGPAIIHGPEDWAALRPLNPREGLLAEVVTANQLIGDAVKKDTPFIQTIFNPLSQAKTLGRDRLLLDMRRYPDALKAGLATLTQSTLRFIEALKPTGCGGIFLALQHATYNLLTEAEYREFGRPYDLQILQAAAEMGFSLIHLHGENVMFDVVADYPAQAINWHDVETPPSLAEGLTRTRMAVCGGLRQWETLLRGTPEAVAAEAKAAIAATDGRRFILGTGCVTPITAPVGNMLAARRAVEV